AHLLGFSLRQEGDRVRYRIGSAAWDTLKHQLGVAHAEDDPPASARITVLGWVDSLGPAFESGDAAQVLTTAADFGFRKLSLSKVKARWKSYGRSWRACHHRAKRRNQRQGCPDGARLGRPQPPGP